MYLAWTTTGFKIDLMGIRDIQYWPQNRLLQCGHNYTTQIGQLKYEPTPRWLLYLSPTKALLFYESLTTTTVMDHPKTFAENGYSLLRLWIVFLWCCLFFSIKICFFIFLFVLLLCCCLPLTVLNFYTHFYWLLIWPF